MNQNIIESISKVCDPHLNNNDRRELFMIIDNYQKQFFNLEDLRTFLSPSLNQQVKIFGLKCLENFILYKWSEADKTKARTYLIEIIKEYNNFNVDDESERVMRWVIAKSVMYFIRHECPQNCSTIIKDLVDLKGNGIMTQALVLSIFYCLSECLPIDSQMPEKRKKEVIGYLTENYDIIMEFSLSFLRISNHVQSSSINIQIESIKNIQSFSGWIKFESLCSISDEMFSVLINCLNVSNSDFFVLEAIETILDRKVRSEDKCFILNILMNNENNWNKLLMNMEIGLKLEINPYSDEKFRYLQKCIDLLIVIGNIFINNWLKFAKHAQVIYFDKFINVVQLATSHPVKILAVELLSFWYNGFKIDCEDLRLILSSKAEFLLPLLQFYSIKVSVRNPANIDHEYLVNLIEQKDEESYINRIRYEASRTISCLTEYFTQGIITLCLDMVYSAIANIQHTNGNCLSNDSDVMRQLEASRFFCRCVMHVVFRPYSKNLQDQVKNTFNNCPSDVISKARDIITSILAFDNSKVHVATIYLDLLCLLFPLVADHNQIIKECLEKIFMWFHISECLDQKNPDYGLWRQVNKNCGISILRVFRDYHFLITPSLFENIFTYYKSKCQKLYEHPIIIEAMTIYICYSSNYTVPQQQSIFAEFFGDIKEVLLSELCCTIFTNGNSVLQFLQMNKPAPICDYNTKNIREFKDNVTQAVNSLYGICSRISSNETDVSAAHTKSQEIISIIACPLNDYIMPLLPSLLKIIRSINQILNSNELHPDFSSLKRISDYYRDTMINNKSVEKCHPNNAQSFAQVYINNCRNFVCRLHETIWLILAKCCLNFRSLYYMKEWPHSIVEYVFADLHSFENFNLNPLIKTFVIPFVQYCPLDRFNEIMLVTVIPFINYMFERLQQHWSTIETDDMTMDNVDFNVKLDDNSNEGNNELCNEIIEEEILRFLSKSFCELLKLTLTMGPVINDDANKGLKLGILTDRLCQIDANNQFPVILLLLNNICRSITWKDSHCCAKISQLIQPILTEIHSRGLLSIDIILFIFQQMIYALNLFSTHNFVEIKIILLNLGVSLYDDYISKDVQFINRFVLFLDKSSGELIKTFQHKMAGKLNLKIRRETLETLLQPYIRVPINQLFSQEVSIKDLPPLLKPHWKIKKEYGLQTDSEDPLNLEDFFK